MTNSIQGLLLVLKKDFETIKVTLISGKIRFGVVSHLFNVCKSATCKTECLQVQHIEHVCVRKGEDRDKLLWEEKKYWQAQLFTLTQGLNNMNERYSLNRRGYGKQLLKFCFTIYDYNYS